MKAKTCLLLVQFTAIQCSVSCQRYALPPQTGKRGSNNIRIHGILQGTKNDTVGFVNDFIHSTVRLPNEKTQAFLERLHLPSLSEEEATEMTHDVISSQEISNTIKVLKNIKSPGTDGF